MCNKLYIRDRLGSGRIGGCVIFQQITLQDKPLFDRYFQERPYENSECTFTNLFMWRKAFQIEWAEIQGHLCVKGTWNGETYIFALCGALDDTLSTVMDQLVEYFARNNHPFLMKGVPQVVVNSLAKLRPGCFDYREDRDNFDYVYLAQDLIHLKGRKYSGKKNHINAFTRLYGHYTYQPLTNVLAQECMYTALEWHKKKIGDKRLLSFEKDAILEALASFSDLGLAGGAILIDGRVEAFAFGEPINSDTAVIHIEKANPDIRGIYQMINRDFCRNVWHDKIYINREEDMGIPGLRKAKSSYHPVKMIEKYDVFLR